MVVERVMDYPGYLVRFRSTAPQRRAALMLHGFPAVRGIKNLDLAIYLCETHDLTVYLLHYRGLGESPGQFRFTASIKEAGDLLESRILPAKYSDVSLIGHSWGGLVACNLARRFPTQIARLFLASPFFHIDYQDPLYEGLFMSVKTETPYVFRDLSEEEIRRDFDVIIKQHLPSQIVPGLRPTMPVAILQAEKDDLTRTPVLQKYLARFPTKPDYREIDLDHSFTQDRPRFFQTVAEMMEL